MRQNFILLGLLAVFFLGCKKENSSSNILLITTMGVVRVGYTVATCNVFLENTSDTTIKEFGVCWNLSGLPTLADSVSYLRTPNSVPHVYSIFMPQLKDNAIYYARGYIKNTSGYIGYGATIKFKTLAKEPVTVLFQQNYENYVWSDSHFGFFIDEKGNIRGYNLIQWNPTIRLVGEEYPPINNSFYPKADLEFNYYLTDTLYGILNPDTLDLMKNKIFGLLNSTIITDQAVCNDYGQNSFYAYYFDSDNEQYQMIVIEGFGDMCIRNTNSDALEISEWLFRIARQYNPYFVTACDCGYH